MAYRLMPALGLAGALITPAAPACPAPHEAVLAQSAPQPEPVAEDPATASGRADAERDVARGALKLLVFTVPTSAIEQRAAEMMQRRYGVVRVVVGDEEGVTPVLERYAHAYNGYVRAALEAAHGANLLDRVAAEARALHDIETTISARPPGEAAVEQANLDFSLNRHRLYRLHPVDTVEGVYEELLQEKFDLSTIVLQDVGAEVHRYVTAYNERTHELLLARHGGARFAALGRDAARLAAERDIAAGTFRLLVYGLPRPSDGEYRRLLKERFGIEAVPAGCVPPVRYDPMAYNEPMKKAIEARFGQGVIERTEAEAQRLWEQRIAAGSDA